ncbi:MAG: acetylxylan esterase [Candidatus Aenigmarchaeota archaeon]|nr:acetylxylan esterase [Candidatus Aenigmarchaeota archaeon]
MPSEKVFYENTRSLKIAAILDKPEKSGKNPAVIICHGFTSFKEFKPLVKISQKLVENNFITMRFDFSNCIGESEGRCEDMLVSHQIDDLISSINFLSENESVDKKRISVVGHSLGAFTAILTASADKRIRSIVPVSSPAKFEWHTLFDENTLEKWAKEGLMDHNTFKKGHVKLHYNFIEDLKEYDATKIIRRVKSPTRFIHGSNDIIVPPKNSQALFENANDPKDLRIIENADHVFLKDEFIGQLVDITSQWCIKHGK